MKKLLPVLLGLSLLGVPAAITFAQATKKDTKAPQKKNAPVPKGKVNRKKTEDKKMD